MSAEIQTQAVPPRKRIALFLDGTWNTVGDNTNVWRLKALCAAKGSDGVPQVAYYTTGLGTSVGEKLGGGMFGFGLDQAVVDAYKWLVERYEPGDEIFLFGFSRGAFTARSLAGFISLCGLLKPGAPLGIGQLYDRYRRNAGASTIWKLREAREAGAVGQTLEERWMLDYSSSVPIRMIGVWDTVGALGIPFGHRFGVSRSGFASLHTGLRTSQENAYHAVAVDEHRKAFAPTLWTKRFYDDPSVRVAAPRPLAAVEQRWFAGAHANVGGGCRSDLLAQIPLRWLMRKASGHGLTFRTDIVPDPEVLSAAISDSYGDFLRGAYKWVSRPYQRVIGAPPSPFAGGRDETINETIDASVFERWRADPAYRPENLEAWARRTGADPMSLTGSVLAQAPRTTVP